MAKFPAELLPEQSFVTLAFIVWAQSKQVEVHTAIFSKTWNTLSP